MGDSTDAVGTATDAGAPGLRPALHPAVAGRQAYGALMPFFVTALTHVIQRIAPHAVLEMGCDTGRTLELLRRFLPVDTSIRGFDVNRESIEYGRSTWGLDLDVADEGYLTRLGSRSVDVVFTVSVLDHLPRIDGVLGELARISRGHYLAIEPYPEAELRYLDVFRATGRLRTAAASPYSYLHPYDELVPRVGLRAVLDVPMPPYATNWGPLHRLTVWEKPDAPVRVPWRQVRDELMHAAVMRSLDA